MDFSNALKAMKAGKKVTRESLNGDYLDILTGRDSEIGYSQSIALFSKESVQFYILTNEDIFSKEWKVVEDIPEVKIEYRPHFTCPICGYDNRLSSHTNGNLVCKCGMKLKPNMNYSNIKTKEEAEKIVNRLVSEYTNSDNYKISLPSLNIDKTLKPGEIIIKNPDIYTTVFDFKLCHIATK